MKTIITSIIVSFVLALVLLGAFVFTGLGIFIFILITLGILLFVFFFKIIKMAFKIGIIAVVIVLILLVFNTSFSQNAKTSCKLDKDCTYGGKDILSSKNADCFVGNSLYARFFVNAKSGNCSSLSYSVCEDKKCIIPEKSKSYCITDSDCACGGIDSITKNCFIGNKDYYDSSYVNKSSQCPDFCNGIAGNLELRCDNNKCIQISRT